MNILIIEDEPGIYNFLKAGLEEEGYHITIASDGIQGIEKFHHSTPDLVLLDWMLPGMHGIDVCKEIRKNDRTIPILFLTAKDTIRETIDGLRAGANDYIKKPFSFEELLERIKIHFRNKFEDEILTLGDISLNKSSYQVLYKNEEISFTQKEFALLEFLIRNKGKICTRDEIIDKVWNIKFKYDTGVIDVFMNSLRKKLYMEKENGKIKTVRGVGYIAND
ncbi:MAG: response regulator transcription factor [Tannerellaceae bacterium]|nr:response regulator transcription factor [Tannerellaceae bacterium]